MTGFNAAAASSLVAATLSMGLPPALPRIIIGMPAVDTNEVVEWSSEDQDYVLMGTSAYQKLIGYAKAEPWTHERDPFLLALGVGLEVEFYGTRNDHVFLNEVVKSYI